MYLNSLALVHSVIGMLVNPSFVDPLPVDGSISYGPVVNF